MIWSFTGTPKSRESSGLIATSPRGGPCSMVTKPENAFHNLENKVAKLLQGET
jgi:hypothetical protein